MTGLLNVKNYYSMIYSSVAFPGSAKVGVPGKPNNRLLASKHQKCKSSFRMKTCNMYFREAKMAVSIIEHYEQSKATQLY